MIIIKTRLRSSLKNNMLNALLHVLINGPDVSMAQPIIQRAVKLWVAAKERRKLPSSVSRVPVSSLIEIQPSNAESAPSTSMSESQPKNLESISSMPGLDEEPLPDDEGGDSAFEDFDG